LADRLAHDAGVRANVFAADLSAPEAPALIFDFVRERRLQVDFLVNNAGSAGIKFLEDRVWQKQADYLELMMISVAQMCHLFVPPMCEKGFGRVINVASVAGRIARANDHSAESLFAHRRNKQMAHLCNRNHHQLKVVGLFLPDTVFKKFYPCGPCIIYEKVDLQSALTYKVKNQRGRLRRG
jgi:NADP-dependent 3-hydroxy acid dehydrogenase YdfG